MCICNVVDEKWEVNWSECGLENDIYRLGQCPYTEGKVRYKKNERPWPYSNYENCRWKPCGSPISRWVNMHHLCFFFLLIYQWFLRSMETVEIVTILDIVKYVDEWFK